MNQGAVPEPACVSYRTRMEPEHRGNRCRAGNGRGVQDHPESSLDRRVARPCDRPLPPAHSAERKRMPRKSVAKSPMSTYSFLRLQKLELPRRMGNESHEWKHIGNSFPVPINPAPFLCRFNFRQWDAAVSRCTPETDDFKHLDPSLLSVIGPSFKTVRRSPRHNPFLILKISPKQYRTGKKNRTQPRLLSNKRLMPKVICRRPKLKIVLCWAHLTPETL